MSKDTQSIAPSEATTLVNDDGKQQEERTSLTGGQIKYKHDHHSGMMLGDGGGWAAPGVGANLLPPGYTDKSRVRIPIKRADFEDAPPSSDIGSDIKTEKKGGLFSKFSSKRKEANDDIVVVMMSRGDYLKYWAKGADGKFLDSVVEPPEGRKEWMRKQLELNEEMKRQDPTLGKTPRGKGFTSGDIVSSMGLNSLS